MFRPPRPPLEPGPLLTFVSSQASWDYRPVLRSEAKLPREVCQGRFSAQETPITTGARRTVQRRTTSESPRPTPFRQDILHGPGRVVLRVRNEAKRHEGSSQSVRLVAG